MCEEDEKIIHRLKYYNDQEHLAKRIVELQHCIENLRNQLQQKENIIKEVSEYIKDKYDYVLGDDTFLDHDERIDSKQIKHILEILDKVGDEK